MGPITGMFGTVLGVSLLGDIFWSLVGAATYDKFKPQKCDLSQLGSKRSEYEERMAKSERLDRKT